MSLECEKSRRNFLKTTLLGGAGALAIAKIAGVIPRTMGAQAAGLAPMASGSATAGFRLRVGTIARRLRSIR